MVAKTFQPAPTAGKDTYVRDQDATNFGTAVTMQLEVLAGGSPGNGRQPLIEFDLSEIPAGAAVTSATLELYAHQVGSYGLSANLYRITGAWDEATVNWDTRPTYDNTVSHGTISTTQSMQTGWHSWDLATLVQAWIDGSQANHGVTLFSDAGDLAAYMWFRTSDYTDDTTLRPKLTVEWNTPPDAPTQTNPVGGATIDRNKTHRFAWDFADPDAGDSQSKFDLQARQVGSATLAIDVARETTASYYDVAGGTLAAANYEWRVRTYDAQGVQGPWSGWEPFTAADPPAGPTVTDPTSGQTIPTEDHTVEWSAAEQDAYQLRRVADNAGSPDTTIVYFDTGTVQSSGARSRTVTFETNNRWEHLQLRVQRAGLWSDWASVRVEVSYTVPAQPTVTLTAADADGSIFVTVDHPAPAAGEPDVIHHDIYRRRQDVGADGIRVARQVAPTATWRDWAVASGVEYEYAARAVGDNGTSTWSAWAGAAESQQAGKYGGY